MKVTKISLIIIFLIILSQSLTAQTNNINEIKKNVGDIETLNKSIDSSIDVTDFLIKQLEQDLQNFEKLKESDKKEQLITDISAKIEQLKLYTTKYFPNDLVKIEKKLNSVNELAAKEGIATAQEVIDLLMKANEIGELQANQKLIAIKQKFIELQKYQKYLKDSMKECLMSGSSFKFCKEGLAKKLEEAKVPMTPDRVESLKSTIGELNTLLLYSKAEKAQYLIEIEKKVNNQINKIQKEREKLNILNISEFTWMEREFYRTPKEIIKGAPSLEEPSYNAVTANRIGRTLVELAEFNSINEISKSDRGAFVLSTASLPPIIVSETNLDPTKKTIIEIHKEMGSGPYKNIFGFVRASQNLDLFVPQLKSFLNTNFFETEQGIVGGKKTSEVAFGAINSEIMNIEKNDFIVDIRQQFFKEGQNTWMFIGEIKCTLNNNVFECNPENISKSLEPGKYRSIIFIRFSPLIYYGDKILQELDKTLKTLECSYSSKEDKKQDYCQFFLNLMGDGELQRILEAEISAQKEKEKIGTLTAWIFDSDISKGVMRDTAKTINKYKTYSLTMRAIFLGLPVIKDFEVKSKPTISDKDLKINAQVTVYENNTIKNTNEINEKNVFRVDFTTNFKFKEFIAILYSTEGKRITALASGKIDGQPNIEYSTSNIGFYVPILEKQKNLYDYLQSLQPVSDKVEGKIKVVAKESITQNNKWIYSNEVPITFILPKTEEPTNAIECSPSNTQTFNPLEQKEANYYFKGTGNKTITAKLFSITDLQNPVLEIKDIKLNTAFKLPFRNINNVPFGECSQNEFILQAIDNDGTLIQDLKCTIKFDCKLEEPLYSEQELRNTYQEKDTVDVLAIFGLSTREKAFLYDNDKTKLTIFTDGTEKETSQTIKLDEKNVSTIKVKYKPTENCYKNKAKLELLKTGNFKQEDPTNADIKNECFSEKSKSKFYSEPMQEVVTAEMLKEEDYMKLAESTKEKLLTLEAEKNPTTQITIPIEFLKEQKIKVFLEFYPLEQEDKANLQLEDKYKLMKELQIFTASVNKELGDSEFFENAFSVVVTPNSGDFSKEELKILKKNLQFFAKKIIFVEKEPTDEDRLKEPNKPKDGYAIFLKAMEPPKTSDSKYNDWIKCFGGEDFEKCDQSIKTQVEKEVLFNIGYHYYIRTDSTSDYFTLIPFTLVTVYPEKINALIKSYYNEHLKIVSPEEHNKAAEKLKKFINDNKASCKLEEKDIDSQEKVHDHIFLYKTDCMPAFNKQIINSADISYINKFKEIKNEQGQVIKTLGMLDTIKTFAEGLSGKERKEVLQIIFGLPLKNLSK